MNDAELFNEVNDFCKFVSNEAFHNFRIEVEENPAMFVFTDNSLKNIVRNTSFAEFKDECTKYITEWKNKNCEKIKLDRDICLNCFHKLLQEDFERRKEEVPVAYLEQNIKWFSKEWNAGKISCIKCTNQQINNPYLKECPYKLEHLIKADKNAK
jgi:tRNA G10  N-methylase Trm11